MADRYVATGPIDFGTEEGGENVDHYEAGDEIAAKTLGRLRDEDLKGLLDSQRIEKKATRSSAKSSSDDGATKKSTTRRRKSTASKAGA